MHTLSETIKKDNPAKYSKGLIPLFAKILTKHECHSVLDPFAGSGRIYELREFGFETTGLELEPEWITYPGTVVGNALHSPFKDDSFDAIVTSVVYGNRMSDHHNAKDGSRRVTYTHNLGRKLHQDNTGDKQWGDAYKQLHREAYRALYPKVKKLFVLNIKDHIRKFERQYVSGWHASELSRVGWDLLYHEEIETPGMRFGENYEARMPGEMIYVFKKVNP